MQDKSLKTALLEKTSEVKAPAKVEIHTAPPSTQTLKVNLTKIKQQSAQKLQQEKDSRVVGKNQINFFGGQNQDAQPAKMTAEDVEIKDSAYAIDKPNYDFIESLPESKQEKIFKIERQETKKSASPLLKKIKVVTFALLIAVLGAWTIYNGVQLGNVATEYSLRLDQYLLKLGTLDSASGANDLFPTYPDENQGAAGMEKQSNWFDRFCNFVAGIFGG